MTYPMRIPVTFGRLATPKELTEAMADTSTSRIVVIPNQTVIARIPPGVGEAAYKSLVASNADIEQVRLDYDFIVFGDLTAWSEGKWMRPNLDRNNWEPSEDPGLKDHYPVNHLGDLNLTKLWLDKHTESFHGMDFFFTIPC